MQSFLFMPFVMALTLQSRAYEYNKPQVSFQTEDAAYQTQTGHIVQPGTTIIKGQNGRDYEVTMSPSRQIFETRLPPNKETFLVQQIDQPATAAANNHIQQPQFYTQQVPNSLPNSAANRNYQQFYNNQHQHQQQQEQHLNLNSNQRNSVPAVNDAQNHYNQFAVNSNHQHLQQQQQQVARAQQQTGILSQRVQVQQQQAGYFYPNVRQQQQQQQPKQFSTFPQTVQQEYGIPAQTAPQQQQQQQYYPQQYEQYLQQPLRNNNLPNSNNLLNDLVNNQKYISQSEASQLDVYGFKQINDNSRPFTRMISKCDVLGQCEPQNAGAESSFGTDFHHQQVLKQTKALVEPTAGKCQNKFNYQFTGNALTDNQAKAQKGIPVRSGTELKDRRLFPYSETVLTQYPQN